MGGKHTPPPMILAAILDLEFICWQSWFTIAMPDGIDEGSSFSGSAGFRLTSVEGGLGSHDHVVNHWVPVMMRVIE